MEKQNEVMLTSVEQLNEYLKENANENTIISIVLETTGKELIEGGGANG
jgi:hypothetical protein